jgi:hypothetical protein
MSYRGEICHNAACVLEQFAEEFRDAGMREWVHRFRREAEILAIRAAHEDAYEAAGLVAVQVPNGLILRAA